MKVLNVLIFPSGTEIAFEIRNALKNNKYIRLFGASGVDDHSQYVFNDWTGGLPFVGEPGFIEAFNRLLADKQIDYVYPAHDSAIDFFADHEADIQAGIISSPKETVKICRSKEKTYQFFRGQPFIPEFYPDPASIPGYPVFVKPKEGQGSEGAQKINSEAELRSCWNGRMIACEYLPGDEYTVDCFTDLHGQLQSARMRDRARVRNGISVRSSLCCEGDFMPIALEINRRLVFKGAWFFQLKKDADGALKLLEVSPRIPGTMACSRALGINYPLLTLYLHLGIETALLPNDYSVQLDRAFINRYRLGFSYSAVYVDLDDTLTVNGRLNIALVALLFQCKEEGKSIFLLSRHANDIAATLARHSLSPALFNEIYHLQADEKKSDYIRQLPAVFIDDSFRERAEVAAACRIPVFDNDGVDFLLNWRV